jgi:hypothetical protein
VLARLRVAVERRRTPLFDLATSKRRPRPDVFVSLDPPQPLLAAELAQVALYVRSGGAVIAAGSGGGITQCVGWRTHHEGRFFATDSFPVVPPAAARARAGAGLSLPPVGDFLRPRWDDTTVGEGAGEGGATRRARGRSSDSEGNECETLPTAEHDTLLRLVDGRPAALRLRYPGGGTVTLVADVGYFRNRVWRASDVPYFVTPLLVPSRPGGRVAWDEYHQGFGTGRSLRGVLIAWLIGTPGGWVILQLASVLLVGLAVAAVRFGPARPVMAVRRRSPLEHLEALAAGLEGAAGVDTAVALTVSGLRRRLGRTGALSAEEQGSWLAGLELALPTPAGRAAVRRLRAIVAQPGGPERALAAAQAVEDVWKELRPPPPRAAS